MANTADVINKMKNRFNAEAAAGMEEVFQFHIEDAGDYYVVISNATCTIQEGEHDDPSVSLTLSADTLKKLFKGELGGMQAFMTGKVRTAGDMLLATKLRDLFPAS